MMETTINNKMTVRKKTVTLLGFSLFFLVLDRLWGFIYSHTVYSSNVMTYVTFIILLLLFLQLSQKYRCQWTKFSIVWAPYLLYTIAGFLFRFTLQNFTYWLCCLILLLIASSCNLQKALPFKLLFWSGIVALVGVFLQLLFPSFYNTHIGPLFLKSDTILLWTEGMGFNGFTYQLGTTATIILYAEIVLLCMKERISSYLFKKEYLYFGVVILLISGVLLTGKRTLSVVSIIIPAITFFIKKKNSLSKLTFLLFVFVISFLLMSLFVGSVSELEESRMFSRLASSYEGIQSGEDITSNRTALYSLAMKGYESNPVFGIGVGNFPQYSRTGTDVHNTYLQVLCEQGLLGFALYVIPMLFTLIFTYKLYGKISSNEKPYINMALAFQIMHILNAMTENCNLGCSYFIYFIGVALAISIECQYRKQTKMKLLHKV